LAATILTLDAGDQVKLTWSDGARPGIGYVIERKPATGGTFKEGRG
jgi:hypothetical protein